MDALEIGRKLRSLRGEKTIKEVADGVCVSVSAMTMYELGNRIPRDEIKERLADYYNQSIDSLFFAPNGHEK